MKSRSLGGVWLLTSALLSMSLVHGDELDFARDVLPILSDNCFQCHGPDAKVAEESDLRLDSEEDVRRDRGDYAAVMAGDLERSEVYQRIISNDSDLLMPPPKLARSLSDDQKKILRNWILSGAEWGKHWAYEKIQRPTPPDPKAHPIDAFVNAKLLEQGLTPNSAANQRTLARRLYLDLTGLPPNSRQLSEFLQDDSDGNWERLVSRVLASEAYGERMAWDWLEAARYADSNGYQGDRERTMWPWRDWVVDAFNRNLPYDQFTTWQLAGDQLENPTHEQILATGFCRNHMINGEGGRIAEENRVDYVMDMTETMGTVWLGLTLNCCRCHDHKFDPLLQKDYYRFTSFFNQTPVDGKGGDPQTPPVLRVPSDEQTKKLEKANAEIAELRKATESRRQVLQTRQKEWEAERRDGIEKALWTPLIPETASSETQDLTIDSATGSVLASGENPRTDEYVLVIPLKQGVRLSAIRLDAIRHSAMTKGGLARSDSGNFVLTDIRFRLLSGETSKELEVKTAEASFEQGSLKISNAFDSNKKSGWAVWNGKSIDRDHAALFRLQKVAEIEREQSLEVTLAFRSVHAQHNLGYFRLSATDDASPKLSEIDDGFRTAILKPPSERDAQQKKLVLETMYSSDVELANLEKKLNGAQKRKDQQDKAVPKVMVMRDRENPRKTFLLDRGLYNQPAEEVHAKFPSFLDEVIPTKSKAEGKQLRRIDLARWILSRENPLAARVTVNRFWQMLFGVGLVKTAEDFGVQGEYPIQRELLDWLAVEFIESGWDVKHLITTIVTSEAYKRSSSIVDVTNYERDPENRYLARGSRYRLPSWMLRDQALAVSGLLDASVGGPPVFPPQPDGIWKEATFGKKSYKVSEGPAVYRRSLYAFWRRIIGPTMLFDVGKRQVCEVKPLRTNTPMHALTTLNEFAYVSAAKALAKKCLGNDEPGNSVTDSERLQFLSQTVLGRSLSDDEKLIWLRSVSKARAFYSADTGAVADLLKLESAAGIRNIKGPEIEQAVWSVLSLNMLNLDELLSRE